MKINDNQFRFSSAPEPHRQRTRDIIARHPEVRELIGRNPWTIIALLGLVTAITVLSWLVRDSAWWVILLVAYTAGAVINHALFVMVHECSHNLLFKRKGWNMLAGIVANLPHIVPSSVMFSRYHIKHHSFQGIHELDADLPSQWEARLISNSFLGKCVWLLLYPFFQGFRTLRLKEIKPVDSWVVTNFVLEALYIAAVIYFFGVNAFLFLVASFFFSVGLHPLGARWIQEHYHTLDEKQETYSYYGPLNTVAFNVGYHNEHHDFPSVPWNKLPQLKKTASSFYDSLKSHTSWTMLFFRFLFDKNVSLYSRTVRADRGKVAFTDASTPDEDILQTGR